MQDLLLLSKDTPIARIRDFTSLLNHTGKILRVLKLSEKDFVNMMHYIPFNPPETDDIPHPREFTAKYLVNRQSALENQNSELLRFFTSK